MNFSKNLLYFIALALLVIFMIALNESGYGVFALFLLFPASWLMFKAFGEEKPGNQAGLGISVHLDITTSRVSRNAADMEAAVAKEISHRLAAFYSVDCVSGIDHWHVIAYDCPETEAMSLEFPAYTRGRRDHLDR